MSRKNVFTKAGNLRARFLELVPQAMAEELLELENADRLEALKLLDKEDLDQVTEALGALTGKQEEKPEVRLTDESEVDPIVEKVKGLNLKTRSRSAVGRPIALQVNGRQVIRERRVHMVTGDPLP